MSAAFVVGLVRGLLARRWLAAGLVVGLALGLGAFAGRVVVRNDLAVWFVDDDPALAAYRAFAADFGSDEVVVLTAPLEVEAASAAGLARLAAWGRALEGAPGVERSFSLAELAGDEAGARAVLAAARQPARLVGEGGRTAVRYVWLAQTPEVDATRGAILDELRAASARVFPGARVRLAGGGVIYEAINQMTLTEGARFIGLAYLVVIAALLAATRRILWTAAAVVVVSLVDLALLGAMGALGVSLNAVTATLPTLCMILGVANVVHLALAVERAADGRLAEGIAEVLVPCAFNALTTAGALLSLLAASMRVTRELGAFAALGVGLAFVLSLVVVVALAPRARSRPRSETHARRGARVGRFAAAAARNPGRTVVLFALFAAGFAALSARVEVDTRTADFLDEDHPARADHRAVEAAIGPYVPLELRVETGGTWTKRALLDELLALSRELEADPRVGAASSAADLLVAVNARLTGEAALPADDAALAQLAGLVELEDPAGLRALVSPAGELRLTLSIPLGSAREMVAAGELAAARARARGLDVEQTGYLPLYGAMIARLVRDQALSFGLAFVVVFGLVGLVVRDRRLWLAALPVNLFPVLAVGGAMGLLGLRLDAATVSVAAIVLGVVVDDSVHLLTRLRQLRALPVEARLVRAAEGAGLAIVTTSAIFLAGFLVLGGAGLKSIAWMGALSATGVGAALVADLLLLPALARLLLRGER